MAHVKRAIDLDHLVWLTDQDLRECSAHDRGILVDLMCVSVNGNPYGFLNLKTGAPIPDESIAATIREPLSSWIATKKRLLDKHRILQGENGVLYIPKMVRDGQIKCAATEGGSRGGNPELISDREPKDEKPEVLSFRMIWNKSPASLQAIPGMREALEEYWEMRKRQRLVWTITGVKRALQSVALMTPKEALRSVRCSAERNWRSFYPAPPYWVDNAKRIETAERVKQQVDSVEGKLKRDQKMQTFERHVADIVNGLRLARNTDEGGLTTGAYKNAVSSFRDKYGDIEFEGKRAVDAALEIEKGLAEIGEER